MLPPSTWISMSTIPERLSHPWFLENLKRTLHSISVMKKKKAGYSVKMVLNIPEKSRRSGKFYKVPDSVTSLPGLTIHNCGEDLGPITKFYPLMKATWVQPKDIILVIDDDITYRPEMFEELRQSVLENPDKISCVGTKAVEGFKGYGFRKRLLMGKIPEPLPVSCVPIDDNVLQYICKTKGIGTKAVRVNGKLGAHAGIDWKATENIPWPRLNAEKYGQRAKILRSCYRDLGEDVNRILWMTLLANVLYTVSTAAWLPVIYFGMNGAFFRILFLLLMVFVIVGVALEWIVYVHHTEVIVQNHMFLWTGMCAGILLLSLATFIFFIQGPPPPPIVITAIAFILTITSTVVHTALLASDYD